jgi:hypothetical protein
MQAKERYTGGFEDLKTKNPLLFIGSPFDPITPLPSARNASAGFMGSVVLQHDGYGHTSISQVSLCTARTVLAYFRDGALPGPGTVCKPDVPIFVTAGEISLRTQMLLGRLNETSEKSVVEKNEVDELLEAMRDMGFRGL